MGPVSLEVRYPKEIDGIAADPQPDWSFNALLLELNSVENKLKASPKFSYPFSNAHTREASTIKGKSRASGAFMMQVLDSELDIDSDDEEEEGRAIVPGRRFTCADSYSDSEVSEDESAFGNQCKLMDKIGFVEGALSELTHEQKLSPMEEMRNQILELEKDVVNENEKYASVLAQVDKYRDAKREMERKFDMQYQRRIAEALDNHLTAVQRDHEHKSQIEERRIRDDAVREEARRREKALQEEKVRQEKIKAEAEMQARIEAERAAAAKSAALEAERKAAEEAAKKKTAVDIRSPATGDAENSSKATGLPQGSTSQVTESRQSTVGNMIRGAENALELEQKRLQTYTQLAAEYNALKQGSNLQDFGKHEQKISRNMRQITGSKDNVRAKAVELIRLITDASYPQSISIVSFADKFVSLCENPSGSFNRSVYAYGHVIVLVTSRVQVAMDILIAKLNRVCIYTVPKHRKYSKAAFESTEAYYKAIGYREKDSKLESSDSFVERLGSYMKLYGAIVQTEVDRVHNSHGISHGWAWLARFLNTLPSNLYTAVALQSFLEIAGFALHRRYRSQFKKLLRIIEKKFLSALQTQQDPKLTRAVVNIRNYIESNQYLKEPEGWQLESDIKSNYCDW